jgi:hypothetical protein
MLSRIFLSLLAVVTGAYLLFLAADPMRLLMHVGFFEQHGVTQVGRWSLAATGLILLAIVPAEIFVWAIRRRYAKTLMYRVGGDRVTVSLQAVEEALSRALENDASVRTATIRLLANRWRRRVEVACALVLYEDSDVSVVDTRCQQLLRARFKEVMSGVKRVQFSLHIDRLRSRASDPGQARLATAADDGAAAPRAPSTTGGSRAIGSIVPLPGLMATGGDTSKEAAAALLGSDEVPVPSAGATAAEHVVTAENNNSGAVTVAEPVYDHDPLPSQAQTPVPEQPTPTQVDEQPQQHAPVAPEADDAAGTAAAESPTERKQAAPNDMPENFYAGPAYPVAGDEEDDTTAYAR